MLVGILESLLDSSDEHDYLDIVRLVSMIIDHN